MGSLAVFEVVLDARTTRLINVVMWMVFAMKDLSKLREPDWKLGVKYHDTTEWQKPRSDQKKLAHYIGMDPTAKGYRERILAGAKKYGERAMALAKQGGNSIAIQAMKIVTKMSNVKKETCKNYWFLHIS